MTTKTPVRSAAIIVLGILSCSLAACSSTPERSSLQDGWQRTSHGDYLNPRTGELISGSRYAELVAGENYQRILERGGDQGWCRIPN